MDDAEKIIQALGNLVIAKCPSCGKIVPTKSILSVRGKAGCLECHLNWIWDFIEGDRRAITGIIEEISSVNWEGDQKGNKE